MSAAVSPPLYYYTRDQSILVFERLCHHHHHHLHRHLILTITVLLIPKNSFIIPKVSLVYYFPQLPFVWKWCSPTFYRQTIRDLQICFFSISLHVFTKWKLQNFFNFYTWYLVAVSIGATAIQCNYLRSAFIFLNEKLSLNHKTIVISIVPVFPKRKGFRNRSACQGSFLFRSKNFS